MRLSAFLLILPLLLILTGCIGISPEEACPGNDSRVIVRNESEMMVGISLSRDGEPTWLLPDQRTIIDAQGWIQMPQIYIFLPSIFEGEAMKRDVVYVDRLPIIGGNPGGCVTMEIVEQMTAPDGEKVVLGLQRYRTPIGA